MPASDATWRPEMKCAFLGPDSYALLFLFFLSVQLDYSVDVKMLSTTPMSTAMMTNGQGGGTGGKNTPPAGSFVNHVALDDERRLREMYEFGEKLGEGTFGVVWRVTHLGTGVQYACKIINKEKVGRSCSHSTGRRSVVFGDRGREWLITNPLTK